ncbi:MAG TPA: cytochrome c biogenesis protein CcdA [Candidatus Angelobacter sp.]|nr:cytochrome c biogenesis protein CcdA [Candidatus Angelobacter sp.]
MIAAFIAGLVSFLSPCVLPLVPGYVSLISGASVEQLQSADRRLMRTVMLHSVLFILGFSVVFVILGAVATGLGQLAHDYKRYLTWVAGVIIIIFGLHLLGVFKIKALYADKRMHNVEGGKSPIAAFFVGFAFAFGWTPCIGPILGGILGMAATSETVSRGIVLLCVYSLGLAVPFLLTSLGIDRFLRFYGTFRKHLSLVEKFSGVLLIAIGALILSGHFTWLSSKLGFLNRFTM